MNDPIAQRTYSADELRTWRDRYGTRRWRAWECRLMNWLDVRYWRCECEYWPPYGLCVMAGCRWHD